MEPSNWDTLAYFYNQTSYGYVSWNVSKSYNPSTGVFSCSANAQSIRRNSDLGYITVYPTPSVWLVTNLN